MPYKDKEKQRKAVKEAVEKHRKGITSEGITEKGITQYPPIVYALADPNGLLAGYIAVGSLIEEE